MMMLLGKEEVINFFDCSEMERSCPNICVEDCGETENCTSNDTCFEEVVGWSVVNEELQLTRAVYLHLFGQTKWKCNEASLFLSVAVDRGVCVGGLLSTT